MTPGGLSRRVLVLWLLLAVGAGGASESIDPLTSIVAVRELNRDEARVGRLVEIEGTVTFYDPELHSLFIQDGTNGLFVPTGTAEFSVGPGDRVLVWGRTAEGSYAPLVVEPKVTSLGDGEMPKARPAVYSELMSGNLDGQRIELSGVIRSVGERGGWLVAKLATRGGVVNVCVSRPGPERWEYLVGSEVRVTGACGVLAEEGRATGVQAFVAHVSELVVERSAPPDPFELEQTAIADLLVSGGADARLGFVHLAGRVTALEGSRHFRMQDASGEIEVSTESTALVRQGQNVRVAGFQSLSTGETRLEAARLLVESRASEDEPGDVALDVGSDVLEGRVLVTAEEVRRLSKAEAERRHPVRLRGVATYCDPEWNMLFVQDATAGIFVNLGEGEHDVRFGQQVQIDGVSGPGDFAPVVESPTIRVLGPGTFPEPVSGELTHLLTGREDSQWVEMEGIVRSVWADSGHWHFEIAQPTGRFRVTVPGVQGRGAPLHLVDAAVRVKGACGSLFNQRRQLLGVQVFVPDPSFVQVEVEAPVDAWSIPSQSIGSLLQFDPHRASGHRTEITGVVTMLGRDQQFFVQDETGALKVTKLSDVPIEAGDRIEVLGFPALGGHAPVLEDTVYRVVGRGKVPNPVEVSAEEALSGDFSTRILDNHRVRIQGLLVDVLSSAEGPVLLVQDGGHLVNAHFEAELTTDKLRRLRPGSIVNLTGICTIQVDQDRQPLAMRLHLTSPEDVRVVQSAPWWRSAYTARVVYVGGLVGLACVAWVMLLRRQVRLQARTIREKLERELALERRARTLTEHSVVGIWQVAPDGRTVYVNPAMRRLLELDEETEFLGRDADSFLPGLVALSRDGVAGYAVDTTVVERESEMMTMTGRRRAVLASVAPIVDPEGRLESWIGTAMDITQLKEVERELGKARDLAIESARLKSEFLANMSHEIRTPMNGVIGMIDLLLGTPLNRDQKDFARTVRDSAELLMTLINDILDFSKIEAGRLELDEVDFELQEVVESSIQLLSHRALEQGLGFGSLVGHDVPRIVRGDPTRLRQILLNLLNNAIKFTEKGEVFLEVAREMPAEDGIRLRFEVHDTGIGISSEVRSHLFQAFVQADGSTTRKYGGTGLGLAISRQLVRLFRGEIGVESEPGRGSIFSFTVRLGKAAGPFLDPALSPECFVGKRALVVDDNAINRRIVRHHLGAWGIASDEEARPEAALDRLVSLTEETRYDVAIVDMQMPGMDGLMLAERIRAIPAHGGIPILLLTSMGQDLDRSALRALGIRECLSKPFRQEELRKSLTRVLRGDDTALRSADKAAEASSPSSPSSAEARPAGRSALRILIAEDNAVNQKVAIRQLEALGYKADIVADGVEAVAAFRRSTYDVILMDCQMPRMDGYEATARIRGLEKARATSGLPPVKIIAMTAHAMRGDREKCLAAGMDQYLSKPLVMAGLRKALELAAAESDQAADRPDEDTEDVLSVQALDQIRELGSEDLLKEIVDLYLAESPPLVARMREAWQSGDRGALEMLVHTLKGSSRHVGANRLAAVLSDVELRSQKGTAISDEGELAAVEAAFDRTRDALREVCCQRTNQGSALPDGLPQTTQSGL